MTLHSTSDPCDVVLDEIGLLIDDLHFIDHPSSDILDFQSEHALRFALAPLLARCATVTHSLMRWARVALESDVPPSSSAGPVPRVSAALMVHELAFALRMDLLHMQDLANRAMARSRWGGLPNPIKHLVTALRQARSLFDGAHMPPERLKGVEASVSSRLAYANLRAGTGESCDPESEPGDVRRALMQVGAALGTLVISRGYAHFRTSDRFRAIGFQRRLVDYFDHDEAPVTGAQIFKDFVVFVRFLSVINQRQDIKRHDRQCLEQWIHDLEDNSSASRDLLASVRHYRDSLYGCDSELDATFDGNVTVSRRGLLNQLRRIEASLNAEPVRQAALRIR